METLRQILVVFLVALLSSSIVVGDVYASTFEITNCNSDGSVQLPTDTINTQSGFFDASQLIGSSCMSLDSTRLFSNIVCNFIGILNKVLSVTYCGLQHELMPALATILSLYVCIFGVQILMGTVQLSNAEILIRLMKIGFIWSFASQGSWGIGMLYKFFVGFTMQGIDWVLGSIPVCVISIICTPPTDMSSMPAAPTSPVGQVFANIDSQLYGLVAGFSDGAGNAIGGLFSGKQEIVRFFMTLTVIAFPLFMLAASLLWMTVKIFARTMISLLMGLTVVAFLIAMSPIFLSCMMYKTTIKLFESWLKYMVAYSLQPVITFAILAIWLGVASQFMSFMTDLSNTIALRDNAAETGVSLSPDNTIGFCPLAHSVTENGPSIQCEGGASKDSIESSKLIPPTKMIEDSKFLYFLTYHLVTLLIVGYAFLSILEDAASIAQTLAGSFSAESLGQHFGSGFSEIGHMFMGEGRGGGMSESIGRSLSSRRGSPRR